MRRLKTISLFTTLFEFIKIFLLANGLTLILESASNAISQSMGITVLTFFFALPLVIVDVIVAIGDVFFAALPAVLSIVTTIYGLRVQGVYEISLKRFVRCCRLDSILKIASAAICEISLLLSVDLFGESQVLAGLIALLSATELLLSIINFAEMNRLYNKS